MGWRLADESMVKRMLLAGPGVAGEPGVVGLTGDDGDPLPQAASSTRESARGLCMERKG